jgi:hypothetical protein
MCSCTFSPVFSPNAGEAGLPIAGLGVDGLVAHRDFSHRNAAATPAAASSPAPIAASVAGTTFSWIGESACAGRP